MKSAIIRGVWSGEEARYCNLEKTIAASAKNEDTVDRVYCYGKRNTKMLQKYGYDSVLMNKWPCRTKAGHSHWLHKNWILYRALEEYDQVLWTDWDVHQMKPLPTDFWAKLNSGPSFRSSLVVQRTPGKAAWWRIPVGNRHREVTWQPAGTTPIPNEEKAVWAAKLMPSGGYLYVRGRDVAESFLKTHNEFPTWKGQPVMALIMDRWHNGWIGASRYKKLGYEPYGYFYGFQAYKPTETIWQCGERNWSWRVWKKGLPTGGIPRRL